MKSLYEGLLDTIDSDIDKEVVDNWLKQHGRGKFKTMLLKNGSYKVWGDLIIRNARAIPALNISYIEGSLHIENCDIVSLDGIFDRYGTFRANVSITDCKKLQSISELPFNIRGRLDIINCPSLKSLEGVDSMADEISIMRCGKRFSQDAVHKAFPVTSKIFCSEEEEVANIKESFQDAILIRMYDQLVSVKSKMKISDVLGRGIALDKISSSTRQTFEMPGDVKAMKTRVRKFAANGNNSMRGFAITETWDGEFTYLYDFHQTRFDLRKNDPRGTYLGSVTNVLESLTPGNTFMDNVHYVHVYVAEDDELWTWQKTQDRLNSRKGMISNDPAALKKMRDEQVERYKAAVRRIKAERKSSDYQAEVAKVEAIMKRFSAFMNKMITDTSWASSIGFKATEVFDSIRMGFERGKNYQKYGVIYCFQNWTSCVVRVCSGQSSYSGVEDIKRLQNSLDEALGWANRTLSAVGL
jgi:hypothetical protein